MANNNTLQGRLLDSPEVLSSMRNTYRHQYCITCASPEEVWVSGDDSQIIRVNSKGKLKETVTTASGRQPSGLTVTRQGDLIYVDYSDKSINRVRHGMTEKIISLQDDWSPVTAISTASEDLLITMMKSSEPSRVVRYSGSIERQVIQFDDQGKPLFSVTRQLFIDGNEDMICVSDEGTSSVVAVNQEGKFFFRYTGNPYSQMFMPFSPRGLVVDNLGNILVTDYYNDRIHIVGQQGNFIRFIDNCQLSQPDDLSLDKNNTLYVAEFKTGRVKVIKYLT